MNIWLKEISVDDSDEYGNLLIELSRYPDVYARPVPADFELEEFESFKRTRVKMAAGDNLPSYVKQTSTYWVMDDNTPISYATLKHEIDINKPGGHFGLCLKKEYQNKGLGTIVLLYTFFLLSVAMIIVHEYDFFKFLWTGIITIFMMILVVFVLFMCVILLKQFCSFIYSVYEEILYRLC